MPDGTVSAVYVQTTDDAFLSTSTNAITNKTVVSGFMLVEGSIKEIKKTLLGFDEKLNILDRKFDSLEQLNQQMPPQDQAVNDTVKVIQNDVVIYYTVTEEGGVKTWTETKREDAAFIPTQNIDPSEQPVAFAAANSNDYSRLSSDARVPSSKLVSQMFAKTDADIAELDGKIANKTERKITSSIGTAEIFNEEDGGGSKFTTYDNKLTSYVGVNNPNQSGSISGIAGQLYVVGNQRTKLNMYDGRFCYVKGDNPATDEEKSQTELVVRSDLKNWALSSDVTAIKESIESQLADKADASALEDLAQTVSSVSSDYLKAADKTELSNAILLKADKSVVACVSAAVAVISADYLTSNDKSKLTAEIAKKTSAKITSSAGTAEVFNEADGGGAKFTAADGTASFVGVNDPASAGSISGIAGQMYVVKDGRKTKLNMYDGRFCYVKGDNPTEAAELAKREIAVMEDVLRVSSDMREADRTLSEQLTDTRATLAGVSADYLKSSDRTELSNAIILKADADDLTALAGTVNAISGDYLKAADKTELSNAILLKADQTTFELSVQTLESGIGTKADKSALDELSGTVGSISADYLKSSDKAELTGAIAAKADKTALELSVQNLVDADATKADLTALNDYYTKSETAGISSQIVAKDAVTVAKLATAEDTFFATYEVRQNGAKVGDSINIPKDFLVKSGEVKTCVEADKPISGLKPGDKYLDFTVNAKEGEGEESHIYIDVRDLTDVYKGASTGVISVGIGNDNKISADIIAGSIGDDRLSSGCVTMPKLSESVSSFVTDQYDNAVDYTDGEIDALSAVYLSKANGGTVSAEMSVKGGLTIKDSSLFIPFRTGPYSNLSIGNTAFLIENVTGSGSSEIAVSYPSVTGTMAVKSDVDNAIRALTKDINGAKSKTVTRITETSGIISAQFEDILVQQSQVQDLTSDYWKKTETSSATQLADKFKTLSTYTETKTQLSSDGYALVSKTSSDVQLAGEFSKQADALKGIISGLWSGLSGYAYQDEGKTTPKTSATITVDDLAATLTNVMSFISSAWFSMNA